MVELVDTDVQYVSIYFNILVVMLYKRKEDLARGVFHVGCRLDAKLQRRLSGACCIKTHKNVLWTRTHTQTHLSTSMINSDGFVCDHGRVRRKVHACFIV